MEIKEAALGGGEIHRTPQKLKAFSVCCYYYLHFFLYYIRILQLVLGNANVFQRFWNCIDIWSLATQVTGIRATLKAIVF